MRPHRGPQALYFRPLHRWIGHVCAHWWGSNVTLMWFIKNRNPGVRGIATNVRKRILQGSSLDRTKRNQPESQRIFEWVSLPWHHNSKKFTARGLPRVLIHYLTQGRKNMLKEWGRKRIRLDNNWLLFFNLGRKAIEKRRVSKELLRKGDTRRRAGLNSNSFQILRTIIENALSPMQEGKENRTKQWEKEDEQTNKSLKPFREHSSVSIIKAMKRSKSIRMKAWLQSVAQQKKLVTSSKTILVVWSIVKLYYKPII